MFSSGSAMLREWRMVGLLVESMKESVVVVADLDRPQKR